MKKLFIFLILFCPALPALAEQIEFPTNELAKESVLPVFENTRAVLNRNIVTKGKIDFGLGAGMELNEPYYADMIYQAEATYHFTETSGFNVQGIFWQNGLSSYGKQLASEQNFDASSAPHSKWTVIGNYQFVAYYGKISITKHSVMNLNLYGLAGLGYINMGSTSTIGLNLGIGQNFFLTKKLALRVDIRMLIFRGPNAASKGVGMAPGQTHNASDFDQRMYFNNQLGLSLAYLL